MRKDAKTPTLCYGTLTILQWGKISEKSAIYFWPQSPFLKGKTPEALQIWLRKKNHKKHWFLVSVLPLFSFFFHCVLSKNFFCNMQREGWSRVYGFYSLDSSDSFRCATSQNEILFMEVVFTRHMKNIIKITEILSRIYSFR